MEMEVRPPDFNQNQNQTPTLVLVEDFRAGATHTGWALLVEECLAAEKAERGFWKGVRVFQQGRAVILRPQGRWDVFTWGFEGGISELNEHARVVAQDSTRNDIGRAVVAVVPGGVIRLWAYAGRGPSTILRYLGEGQWDRVTGLDVARALGWIPGDDWNPTEIE
jgi:hypothetical protein